MQFPACRHCRTPWRTASYISTAFSKRKIRLRKARWWMHPSCRAFPRSRRSSRGPKRGSASGPWGRRRPTWSTARRASGVFRRVRHAALSTWPAGKPLGFTPRPGTMKSVPGRPGGEAKGCPDPPSRWTASAPVNCRFQPSCPQHSGADPRPLISRFHTRITTGKSSYTHRY